MGAQPRNQIPPAARDYLAALDDWLAAGLDRNDTAASVRLDVAADAVRASVTPDTRTRARCGPLVPMAKLLRILR